MIKTRLVGHMAEFLAQELDIMASKKAKFANTMRQHSIEIADEIDLLGLCLSAFAEFFREIQPANNPVNSTEEHF